MSFILILITTLFCGCQTASFYRQAIAGQCQILTHQEPIDKLIADPATPPKLREELKEILALRQFAASELKLPVKEHYLKYVDLHRPFVVWDVYAAPPLSLEPKTWWFPIVGRASYRGYFSEAGARRYAETLKKKGFDVFVGGVETYSTLGWFHDPVLNTFIDDSQLDLADIIFHELGHQELFVPGDSDFNEAFATSVAEEGVRRWFAAKNKPEMFARLQAELAKQEEFTRIIMTTIADLERVYGDPKLSDEVKLRQKRELIEDLRATHARLKAKWGGESPYDGFFKGPINNAKLSTIATYYELVPAFRELLRENGGDIEKFYASVRSLGKLPIKERTEKLHAMLEKKSPTLSAEAK